VPKWSGAAGNASPPRACVEDEEESAKKTDKVPAADSKNWYWQATAETAQEDRTGFPHVKFPQDVEVNRCVW